MGTDPNADPEVVYEEVVQHSDASSSVLYEDILIDTPEKSLEDYEVLLPSSQTTEKRRIGHLTFPSGISFKRSPATDDKGKTSEKPGKTLDRGRIGEMVVSRFTKFKKEIERLGSRDKDNKNDKPSSLSEMLRPRQSERALPNEYQTGTRKPKLPERNKVVKALPHSDLKKCNDYQNTTLEPKGEATVDCRALSNIECPPGNRNNLPVKHDDEPDDDYLMPAPKPPSVYRAYVLQKQKDLKSELAKETEENTCLKVSENKQTAELPDNDGQGLYEDMFVLTETAKEQLPSVAIVGKGQTAASESIVKNKSFSESSCAISQEHAKATGTEEASESQEHAEATGTGTEEESESKEHAESTGIGTEEASESQKHAEATGTGTEEASESQEHAEATGTEEASEFQEHAEATGTGTEEAPDNKSIGHVECSLKRLKMKDIRNVLTDLTLEQYADIFEANRIDGHILSTLTLNDFINELGLKRLEAVRLCEFIKSGHVPT